MPTTLYELIESIDKCIVDLEYESMNSMSTIKKRTLEMVSETVPEGLWGTPYLKEAFLENSDVIKDNNVIWYAHGSTEHLPEPNTFPPRNTIRDFLEWWNSQKKNTISKKTKDGSGGHKKSEAPWWNLSGEQKETLEHMRSQGYFGGQKSMAFYWWVQEEGMGGNVQIKGQKYFKKLIRRTNASARYWIAKLNSSYLKHIGEK